MNSIPSQPISKVPTKQTTVPTEADLRTLEAEKLRREIAHLSLPAWLTQNLLALFSALAIGLTAWYTGLFDASAKKLEAERAWLEVEKAKRMDLESENTALASKIATSSREKEAVTRLVEHGARILVKHSEDDGYHIAYWGRNGLDLSVFDGLDEPQFTFDKPWSIPKRRTITAVPQNDDECLLELAQLSRIASLKLDGVVLTLNRISVLAKLEGLEIVELTGAELDDERIKSLPVWPHVIALSLSRNPFSVASRVTEYSQLRALDLSGTKINDESLGSILRACRDLEELSIEFTEVTDASAKALSQCPRLKILVAGSRLSFAGTKDLLESKSLTQLRVAGGKLPAEAPLAYRRLNPTCHVKIMPD